MLGCTYSYRSSIPLLPLVLTPMQDEDNVHHADNLGLMMASGRQRARGAIKGRKDSRTAISPAKRLAIPKLKKAGGQKKKMMKKVGKATPSPAGKRPGGRLQPASPTTKRKIKRRQVRGCRGAGCINLFCIPSDVVCLQHQTC